MKILQVNKAGDVLINATEKALEATTRTDPAITLI